MKTKICITLLIVIILFGTIVSCNTIRASTRAQAGLTSKEEYYLGRAAAANILSIYDTWDGNPALTDYLNFICAAITINSSNPNDFYNVAILDTSEINAFATLGGHIFVTRGFIAAARSEDALAGIIAHEIAHIQLKHSTAVINRSRWVDVSAAAMRDVRGLTSIAGIFNSNARTAAQIMYASTPALNALTANFGYSIQDVTLALTNNGFTREQEFEADRTAMSFLAAAGYNPQGLIDILRELNTAQVSGIGLGKTHPAPTDRIENAQNMLGYFPGNYNSAYRQERFLEATRIR